MLRPKKLYGAVLLCGLIVLTLLATRRFLKFADYGNGESAPFDFLLQEPATAQAYPLGIVSKYVVCSMYEESSRPSTGNGKEYKVYTFVVSWSQTLTRKEGGPSQLALEQSVFDTHKNFT